MTKKELIRNVYNETGLKLDDVSLIVNSVFDEITSALVQREKVMISNFGTFEVSDLKPIDVYSPYDGSLIKNVAQSRVRFKSSPHLKNKLVDK